MPRKPTYTIIELANLTGIGYSTLKRYLKMDRFRRWKVPAVGTAHPTWRNAVVNPLIDHYQKSLRRRGRPARPGFAKEI